MAGPSWLAGIFATLMLVTAGYCASRLAAARRWRRATEHDVDLMHAVMGVAMAGMLVPQLNLLRHGAWEIVFATATGWFGWQVVRSRRDRPADRRRPAHHVPHLLACGAMLYMFLAAGTARTGTGMMAVGGPSAAAAHSPGLALPLALTMLGYVIWATDRLTGLPRVAALAAWIPVPAMPAPSGRSLPAPRPGSADRYGLPHGYGLPGEDVPSGIGGRPGRGSAEDRAGPVASPRCQAGKPPMSPRLSACCEIAMGVTMGLMLIQML
jgi:hypothetical protein